MNVNSEHGKFTAGNETLAFTSFTPAKFKHRALAFHGAGDSTRQRTFYLGEALAQYDIGFFCFDFSGHGESSGSMAQSSLAKRCAEAKAALDYMGQPAPTILMGTSMGGYIAAEMLDIIKPDYLVLFCPALYASKAFKLPFDQEFSKILRTPNSFEQNHLQPHLANCTGHVLILIGDQDTVIPDQIIEFYGKAFIGAKSVQTIILKDAPHALHLWANENKEQEALITNAILKFIS